MSYSLSFHFTKAPLLPFHQSRTPVSIISMLKAPQPSNIKAQNKVNSVPIKNISATISNLAIHVGTLLATVEPALAVTGMNYYEEEDLGWILTRLGICAFVYFILIPPIIMNWLRVRWYRRGLAEMFFQFMFVFIFFPGVMLWAPFLNFRKFPRDPDMKYPWDRPQDPSKIKSEYRKYPWATPEDYE